jgi:hypothetical protein
MRFAENVETLRLNITDLEAVKLRREELERGAVKVNISRIHSQLIELEIHHRAVIDVTLQAKRLN